MRLSLLLLLLITLPSLSPACDLLAGRWSKHHDKSREYNEVHSLLGVQCQKWSVGSFVNSYEDDGAFVGYEVIGRRYQYINTRLTVAAVTGYKIPVLPMVSPGATIKVSGSPVQLDIDYLPMVGFTAGFRIPF